MDHTPTVPPGSILLACVLIGLVQVAGEAQPDRQGLRLCLSPGGGNVMDVRRARTVSLYVREGQPVSPFLPAGPFTAKWKGALTFDGFGKQVTISARGRGTLSVSVNGETAFDGRLKGRTRVTGQTVGIQNGNNPLTVTYQSPEDGPAWLRLYWSAKDFYPEPLPVDQLVHERTKRMKRYEKRRAGRELFLNHRCVRCHRDEQDVMNETTVPELNMDAPDLSAAGTKFNTEWLANWIADPHEYRADASMPAVLHGDPETVRQQASDIAAYLSTRAADDAAGPDVSVTDRRVKRGREHFRRFGCMGCHTVNDGHEQGNSVSGADRIPLSYVAEKWNPGPLARYLIDPRDHYQWNPMPDFRLDKKKATALAAYLLDETGANKQNDHKKVKGQARRGKRLMAEKQCVACHKGSGVEASDETTVPSLQDLFDSDGKPVRRGCIASTKHRGKAPDFGFAKQERKALARFFTSAKPASLTRHVPAVFASRQVKRLNCISCHRRDGQASVWSRLPDDRTEVELDQDRTHGVKQLRPPLTWVGDMLQYDWLEKTISGSLKEKTRPWLVARMPGFGPYSTGLARGLAAQHGYPPERVPYSTYSKKLGRAGKKIVEQLNCYSCHGVGDRKPNAFEVQGINFFKSGDRLHRNFAIRWTLAPGRVRGDSGMPAFFQWGKPSPLSDILNGNLHEQMKAIWQYLRHAEQLESE